MGDSSITSATSGSTIPALSFNTPEAIAEQLARRPEQATDYLAGLPDEDLRAFQQHIGGPGLGSWVSLAPQVQRDATAVMGERLNGLSMVEGLAPEADTLSVRTPAQDQAHARAGQGAIERTLARLGPYADAHDAQVERNRAALGTTLQKVEDRIDTMRASWDANSRKHGFGHSSDAADLGLLEGAVQGAGTFVTSTVHLVEGAIKLVDPIDAAAHPLEHARRQQEFWDVVDGLKPLTLPSEWLYNTGHNLALTKAVWQGVRKPYEDDIARGDNAKVVGRAAFDVGLAVTAVAQGVRALRAATAVEAAGKAAATGQGAAAAESFVPRPVPSAPHIAGNAARPALRSIQGGGMTSGSANANPLRAVASAQGDGFEGGAARVLIQPEPNTQPTLRVVPPESAPDEFTARPWQEFGPQIAKNTQTSSGGLKQSMKDLVSGLVKWGTPFVDWVTGSQSPAKPQPKVIETRKSDDGVFLPYLPPKGSESGKLAEPGKPPRKSGELPVYPSNPNEANKPSGEQNKPDEFASFKPVASDGTLTAVAAAEGDSKAAGDAKASANAKDAAKAPAADHPPITRVPADGMASGALAKELLARRQALIDVGPMTQEKRQRIEKMDKLIKFAEKKPGEMNDNQRERLIDGIEDERLKIDNDIDRVAKNQRRLDEEVFIKLADREAKESEFSQETKRLQHLRAVLGRDLNWIYTESRTPGGHVGTLGRRIQAAVEKSEELAAQRAAASTSAVVESPAVTPSTALADAETAFATKPVDAKQLLNDVDHFVRRLAEAPATEELAEAMGTLTTRLRTALDGTVTVEALADVEAAWEAAEAQYSALAASGSTSVFAPGLVKDRNAPIVAIDQALDGLFSVINGLPEPAPTGAKSVATPPGDAAGFQPQAAQPEAVQSEPAQLEPAQPEPAPIQVAQVEPVQSDAAHVESADTPAAPAVPIHAVEADKPAEPAPVAQVASNDNAVNVGQTADEPVVQAAQPDEVEKPVEAEKPNDASSAIGDLAAVPAERQASNALATRIEAEAAKFAKKTGLVTQSEKSKHQKMLDLAELARQEPKELDFKERNDVTEAIAFFKKKNKAELNQLQTDRQTIKSARNLHPETLDRKLQAVDQQDGALKVNQQALDDDLKRIVETPLKRRGPQPVPTPEVFQGTELDPSTQFIQLRAAPTLLSAEEGKRLLDDIDGAVTALQKALPGIDKSSLQRVRGARAWLASDLSKLVEQARGLLSEGTHSVDAATHSKLKEALTLLLRSSGAVKSAYREAHAAAKSVEINALNLAISSLNDRVSGWFNGLSIADAAQPTEVTQPAATVSAPAKEASQPVAKPSAEPALQPSGPQRPDPNQFMLGTVKAVQERIKQIRESKVALKAGDMTVIDNLKAELEKLKDQLEPLDKKGANNEKDAKWLLKKVNMALAKISETFSPTVTAKVAGEATVTFALHALNTLMSDSTDYKVAGNFNSYAGYITKIFAAPQAIAAEQPVPKAGPAVAEQPLVEQPLKPDAVVVAEKTVEPPVAEQPLMPDAAAAVEKTVEPPTAVEALKRQLAEARQGILDKVNAAMSEGPVEGRGLRALEVLGDELKQLEATLESLQSSESAEVAKAAADAISSIWRASGNLHVLEKLSSALAEAGAAEHLERYVQGVAAYVTEGNPANVNLFREPAQQIKKIHEAKQPTVMDTASQTPAAAVTLEVAEPVATAGEVDKALEAFDDGIRELSGKLANGEVAHDKRFVEGLNEFREKLERLSEKVTALPKSAEKKAVMNRIGLILGNIEKMASNLPASTEGMPDLTDRLQTFVKNAMDLLTAPISANHNPIRSRAYGSSWAIANILARVDLDRALVAARAEVLEPIRALVASDLSRSHVTRALEALGTKLRALKETFEKDTKQRTPEAEKILKALQERIDWMLERVGKVSMGAPDFASFRVYEQITQYIDSVFAYLSAEELNEAAALKKVDLHGMHITNAAPPRKGR